MKFSHHLLGAALLGAAAFAAPMAVLSPSVAQEQAAPAGASPEQIALARAVIDFTGAGSAFDTVIPQLLADGHRMLVSRHPTLKGDLDAVVIALDDELRPRREELLQKVAVIYTQHFTEAELKEIAAFYRSETGKKMTAKMPEIIGLSGQQYEIWVREMSTQIMTRIREEMAKRGHQL